MLLDTTTWTWIYFISEWVIRLVALGVLPSRRTPAAAKTWLLLIFFHPWLGLALFGLVGRTTWPRWRRARMARLGPAFAEVRARLAAHPNIIRPEVAIELSPAVRLAENLGHLPILGGNAAELLTQYEGTIARLTADIDAATDHVHLLFYIFANDRTTQPVIEALSRAVQRGVRCRVMVDAVGSRRYLRALLPRLTAAGVEVRKTLPASLLRLMGGRYDLRNHRKIAVIDGRVGYTGSQNLIDALFKPGITYEELMVRVTGPVVLELQFVFASDWFLETEEVLDSERVFPGPVLAGSIPAQALPSGPGYPTENNQRLMVALVHAARKTVILTTPYFVPDEPLLQAMQTAVLRGVSVHLIVSQKADQALVSLAQRSYYGQLLEEGVQIHLYRKNFLHAKHLSIDDSIVLIGSSNFDLRSFTLNAEVSLLFYDERVTALLHKEEERYMADCELLRYDVWQGRSLPSKVAQRIARLFSPLL